jgi:hypothetical protein
MKRVSATLWEQQAEDKKLDADTYLRQAQRGRQVSANLPVRQSASEDGKELGYGG